MQKKILLTGLLTFVLLMPVPAHAQGYPTFDVAKLAAQITNLIGRFVPIPEVMARVNQVKTTINQIKATASAVVSGDLSAMVSAFGFLDNTSFTSGHQSEIATQAESGAGEASEKAQEMLFVSGNIQDAMGEVETIKANRKKYVADIDREAATLFMYIAMNAPEQSQERWDKVRNAIESAETLQDATNANTMAIMAGNMERLTKISMDIMKLRKTTAHQLDSMPVVGFRKPDPDDFKIEMGGAQYVEEEKEGPDVDL